MLLELIRVVFTAERGATDPKRTFSCVLGTAKRGGCRGGGAPGMRDASTGPIGIGAGADNLGAGLAVRTGAGARSGAVVNVGRGMGGGTETGSGAVARGPAEESGSEVWPEPAVRVGITSEGVTLGSGIGVCVTAGPGTETGALTGDTAGAGDGATTGAGAGDGAATGVGA